MAFRKPLIPFDVEVPTLSTDRYRLEPLTMRWLTQDYAAVAASWPTLDGRMVPPGTLGPITDLSMEQDVVELGWHEREFTTRRSFAFVAISHDDRASLGCCYVYGSPRPDEDAAILTWATLDPDDPGADERLHGEVEAWIADEWPFVNPVFPGRSVPWATWLEGLDLELPKTAGL
jgi:hypothetical protein